MVRGSVPIHVHNKVLTDKLCSLLTSHILRFMWTHCQVNYTSVL